MLKSRAPMIAFSQVTGNVIEIGETVVSFREETGTLQSINRAPMLGKSAKVSVDGREYYAQVWGLEIHTVTQADCLFLNHAACRHLTV